MLTNARLQRWARDKVLSFVPPDGRFKLLEYRFAPASASAAHQVAVPIAMRNHVNLDENGGAKLFPAFGFSRP